MSKQSITSADEIYSGSGFYGPIASANQRKGVPIHFLTKLVLGSPITLDADGMVQAATTTELPNAATITYTTANDNVSPFDNTATPVPASIVTSTGVSASVWTLGVARNITAAVTHATSVVAMTIVVTGYDFWGQKMTENLAIAATGTTQSAAGKKAFKHILSIAITASGNAEANTLNMGWSDVLGLPYKLASKVDMVRAYFNGVMDDSVTIVAADTATATATTGDVRGTVDTASAADGSEVVVWMHVADPNTENGLRGVNQFSV